MDDDFDKPKDLAEIIIAKHRNGSLDTVELRFIPEFVRFEDGNFNQFNQPGGDFRNPLGMITRPSKMNEEEGGDTPF